MPGDFIEIRPQPGPQEQFLANSADIIFYGGAAGGGKTYALLLEPLRYAGVPGFTAAIFRRTSTQVRNPGGLWHESMNLYNTFGGTARQALLEWHFPSGATIRFGHMEHENDRFNWQGAQIAMIGFDELAHFTREQFFSCSLVTVPLPVYAPTCEQH